MAFAVVQPDRNLPRLVLGSFTDGGTAQLGPVSSVSMNVHTHPSYGGDGRQGPQFGLRHGLRSTERSKPYIGGTCNGINTLATPEIQQVLDAAGRLQLVDFYLSTLRLRVAHGPIGI